MNKLAGLLVFGLVMFFVGIAYENMDMEHTTTVKTVKPVSTPAPTPDPVIFKVTAYCPCEKCCGEWADGVTASGHKIQPGDKFVAAPKSLFEFGDMVSIDGYGTVPVLDRGGAIKRNRIDVFFPTHQKALEWGVRYISVNR